MKIYFILLSTALLFASCDFESPSDQHLGETERSPVDGDHRQVHSLIERLKAADSSNVLTILSYSLKDTDLDVAEFSGKDEKDRTVWHYFVAGNSAPSAALFDGLFLKNNHINLRDKQGNTPLIVGLKNNNINISIFTKFISKGADINSQFDANDYLLHYFTKKHLDDYIKEILKHDAGQLDKFFTLKNGDNKTPFELALADAAYFCDQLYPTVLSIVPNGQTQAREAVFTAFQSDANLVKIRGELKNIASPDPKAEMSKIKEAFLMPSDSNFAMICHDFAQKADSLAKYLQAIKDGNEVEAARLAEEARLKQEAEEAARQEAERKLREQQEQEEREEQERVERERLAAESAAELKRQEAEQKQKIKEEATNELLLNLKESLKDAVKEAAKKGNFTELFNSANFAHEEKVKFNTAKNDYYEFTANPENHKDVINISRSNKNFENTANEIRELLKELKNPEEFKKFSELAENEHKKANELKAIIAETDELAKTISEELSNNQISSESKVNATPVKLDYSKEKSNVCPTYNFSFTAQAIETREFPLKPKIIQDYKFNIDSNTVSKYFEDDVKDRLLGYIKSLNEKLKQCKEKNKEEIEGLPKSQLYHELYFYGLTDKENIITLLDKNADINEYFNKKLDEKISEGKDSKKKKIDKIKRDLRINYEMQLEKLSNRLK